MPALLQGNDTKLVFWVLGALLVVVCVTALVLFRFVNLWVQAYMARAPVSLMELIGMRLRKVDPTVIVRARILTTQAGIAVPVAELEAHYLAGGNVLNVTQALVAADRAKLCLDFRSVAAIDLAGRNALDDVQAAARAKLIEDGNPVVGARRTTSQ